MGLDITAYSKIHELRPYDEDQSAEEFALWPNPDFPSQADGLKRAVYYARGEEFRFRAGAYSGYNEWRRWLCNLIHHCTPEEFWNDTKPVDLPFGALIHFSDCEGVIGPATSAKLSQDFRDYQATIDALPDQDNWYVRKYAEWRKAFELASDAGAVSFH